MVEAGRQHKAFILQCTLEVAVNHDTGLLCVHANFPPVNSSGKRPLSNLLAAKLLQPQLKRKQDSQIVEDIKSNVSKLTL